MSERLKQEIKAFRKVRTSALSIIEDYQKNHKTIYASFEKNCIYDWALKEAYDEVSRAYGRNADTPLNVLERMLTKYDEWAHAPAQSSNQFKIAVAAIEDLIDQILMS